MKKAFIQNTLLFSFIFFTLNAFASETLQHWFLVKNTGQWNDSFLYRAEIYGGFFFLEKDGYTIRLNQTEGMEEIRDKIHKTHYNFDSTYTTKHHAIRIKWNNTKGSSKTEYKPYPFYHNYFLGSNSTKWKTNVPVVEEATIKSLYDGIDWRVTGPNFFPKHELIVSPNTDLSKVSFEVFGADGIEINENGSLVMKTTLGDIKESKPIAWQIIKGRKVFISCSYVIKQNNEIGFNLGEFNSKYELIIDPIVVFSTYSGSVGDNFGFTATYDSKGNLYSGGIVDGDSRHSNGGDYPVTLGAFQTVYGGSIAGQPPINLPCDMAISKYASDGKSLLYATYIGGGKNEHPHSLVVDNNDNLIVFGTSNSNNFPVDSLGYDSTYHGNYDLVLMKFSPNGTGLLGGTYIGGSANDGINNGLLRFNYADDFRGDVFVDSSNMVYLATCTSSTDFPVTQGVSQTVFGGALDGVVIKIDSLLRKVEWATFIGDSGHDAIYSLKVIDSLVFIAGGTSSKGLNKFANGAVTSYNGGPADGFLASLNVNSGIIKNFTFYGTSDYDQIFFLDFDNDKNIYFAGQTKGNITRSPNTYGTDNTGQFISMIDQELKNISIETTFGVRTGSNKPDLSPSAFMVDRCNNIFFSGWGANIDLNAGSTKDLPVSSDAIQSTTDNNDFYLIVFKNELKALAHATFFGGTMSLDHVDGGTSRFDKDGIIYQSVCASCPNNFSQSYLSDFPVSADAIFTKNLSRRCSNAAFKIDFQITNTLETDFESEPISGCEPLEVKFTNKSNGGERFLWDFGDGTTDTTISPTHIYENKGVYPVKLTVWDELSCNLTDSAVDTITVHESVKAQFDFENSFCNLTADFIDKSIGNYKILEWDFGDSTKAYESNPSHLYPWGGKFKVTLKIESQNGFCSDSIDTVLRFASYPFTNLNIPNVFTPNNDGINDCYKVLGISEECEQGKIYIYNRWGDMIYKGSLDGECWNGKVFNKGKELPTGVYYYIIKTKRDERTGIKTNGVIHLIR